MTSSIIAPGQTEAPTRRAGRGAADLMKWLQHIDQTTCKVLRPFTLPTMRVLLGVLFIWFGALKVSGASPVESMVSGTLPWVDPRVAVFGLGSFEILLGAGLATGVLLRAVLPLLVAHLAGTFLTFVMLPHLMVTDDNPLLLTEPGEFVVKNLVLISAALVLMTHTRRLANPDA